MLDDDSGNDGAACNDCGARIPGDSQFCPECGSGRPFGDASEPTIDRNRARGPTSSGGFTSWAYGFEPGATGRNVVVGFLYFVFWPVGLALLVHGALRANASDDARATIGKLAGYGFGGLLLLAGLGSFAGEGGTAAGVVSLVVGLFLLPKVRDQIEERSGRQIGTNVVVVVAVVGMLTIGAVAPAEDTTSSNGVDADEPAADEGGDGGSGSAESERDGVAVVISYSGEWSGAVGAESSTESHDGYGSTTITVTGDPEIVAATIQKSEPGGTLRVQIVVDGEVVEEGQTSAEYGVVSISADVDSWF